VCAGVRVVCVQRVYGRRGSVKGVRYVKWCGALPMAEGGGHKVGEGERKARLQSGFIKV